jgi:hypothetical protein
VDKPNRPDNRAPVCRFGPDRRLTALCGVLTFVGIVSTLLSHDRGGQLLFAVATLIVAAYAVTDLLFWPRLVATADGLQVRTPGLRGSFAWSDVEAVRADTRQRLGLRSTTLEIDVADVLLVFSRRALGADPESVASVIRAFEPR